MRKYLLTFAAMVPMVLSADTIVFRDGTRQDGTLVSANSRQVVFADQNGYRHTYNVQNVEQLTFGSGSYAGYNSDNRYSNNGNGNSNVDQRQAVARMRQDLQGILNNYDLGASDQSRIQRIISQLRTVESDAQNGSGDWVDRADMRTAMRDLREIVSSNMFEDEDNQMLRNDMAQLRDVNREMRGTGTRARTR